MNALTVLSIAVALLVIAAVVAGLAYVISRVGPPFFGDDPGGRDPNLPGQFLLWGNGPNYIDFLRAQRKALARKRKERKR
jgi:hypothetical protein